MSSIKEDKIREHRILMEIVVDAYNEGERALGWYYYLEEKLSFPFNTDFHSVLSVTILWCPNDL